MDSWQTGSLGDTDRELSGHMLVRSRCRYRSTGRRRRSRLVPSTMPSRRRPA